MKRMLVGIVVNVTFLWRVFVLSQDYQEVYHQWKLIQAVAEGRDLPMPTFNATELWIWMLPVIGSWILAVSGYKAFKRNR